MDTELADAPDRNRYELRSGEQLVGFIDYRLDDGVITLVHTEVPEAFSGQGHAATLAGAALADARERGLRVVPTCSYVAAYIDKHPEHADLVR